MLVKFIEATSHGDNGNHGKFMLGRFDREWPISSQVYPFSASIHANSRHPSLLRACGWDYPHILVIDLQTGEGALFRPGPVALAKADLHKHQIWVCPLFEPFLSWLYRQDLSDLDKLPALVDLGDTIPVELSGYRRPGPRK